MYLLCRINKDNSHLKAYNTTRRKILIHAMFKLLKKIMVIFLITIAVLIVGSFIFLQQPQFGANPSGARLERIKKSPNYKDGSFQNLSETPTMTNGGTYLQVSKDFFFNRPSNTIPNKPLPAIKTDLKNLPDGKPILVWFGHSSYFLHIDGKNILVDPVFSPRPSPVPIGDKNFAGTDIYTVEDFPEIDLLIITHDHYDHLDYETMLKLVGKTKKICTSLGVGAHLTHWGFDERIISELDWWESIKIDLSMEITATPARHFSGRGLVRGKTLWSSFVLQTTDYKIFIGGDSGYDTHFREIGERFGGFDLAILECGQYNDWWANIHTMPEEVVQVGREINAKVLMPVHWGKFTLALHAWDEPITRLSAKASAFNQPITTPMIGEIVVIDSIYPTKKWW